MTDTKPKITEIEGEKYLEEYPSSGDDNDLDTAAPAESQEKYYEHERLNFRRMQT